MQGSRFAGRAFCRTIIQGYMQAPVLPLSSTASASTHLQRKPLKAFVDRGSGKLPQSRPQRTNTCSCTGNAPAVQISKAAKSQVPQVSRSRITPQGFLAGPCDDTPDYGALDSSPWNKAIMALFRRKMVTALEEDSEAQGYDAIIDLTRKLNSRYKHPQQTQAATKRILKSLFPGWLPPAFSAMLSRPVPQIAAQLNAWVTALTCQWLMGPTKINDVELPDGQVFHRQGVLVERCRYLEESGCASICINSCKVPTQEFFQENMGLVLTMTPNYEDYSCQFSFGQAPLPQDQDDVFSIPCFRDCPSKKQHRRQDQCHGIEVNQQDSSAH